jgi:hypothetical protein
LASGTAHGGVVRRFGGGRSSRVHGSEGQRAQDDLPRLLAIRRVVGAWGRRSHCSSKVCRARVAAGKGRIELRDADNHEGQMTPIAVFTTGTRAFVCPTLLPSR